MSVFVSGTERISVDEFFRNIGLIGNKDIKNSLKKQNQYEIQSKISSEVFHSFVNYLVNDNLPDIHFDNYFEYFMLNQEFQIDIITNLLDTVKQKWRQLENQDRMLQQIVSSYNQLTNDYQQLLQKINLFHTQLINSNSIISSLENQINDLKIENDKLTQENKNLTLKIDDVDAQLNASIQSIKSNVDNQLNQINRKQIDLNEKTLGLDNDIKRLNDSTNLLKNQFGTFNVNILPRLINKDIQTKVFFYQISNFFICINMVLFQFI